ncbi:TMEM165/GDT1 family protein [Phenylobacterium sp.]|uniref:TMEM165/GDT1 family protein n=1 Tax=Phenylobacterium sp. TaxID=1871053 RepID=UPI001207E363|nr:TMEM165/GDT1 family protein [Phenylobacterium sp.]TAL29344.1 MAG: TMEM165/GDT1 family protein [Phenylobacterium sp.]
MEAFLVSTGLVAVAEIGDKTQLLAMVLAAKFRRPVPIILGILVATILNHTGAAALGFVVARWLSGPTFQILVGAGFIAMALWALVPDKDDEGAANRAAGGVFLTTAVAFFLVEIGDKTQIATTLLAARFQDIAVVAAGTTLGMMIANVPAVLLGEAATRIVPLRYVRVGAALIFLILGAWVLAAAFLKPGISF